LRGAHSKRLGDIAVQFGNRYGSLIVMGDVTSLLDRPVYRYAEADRLLRVNPGTVRRWVDGYTRKGVSYPPVVRDKPTGYPWLTWGEFVESRLLSEFRTQIPMVKLRPLVDRLREVFNERYPLSYARPFLVPEGRELLLAAQDATGTNRELWVVVSTGQSVIMTPASRRFTGANIYSDNVGPALSMRADPGAPDVMFDPVRRQGQPTLREVSTSTLAELVSAGEPIEAVAETYDFPVAEVEQAVAYEASRAA
jgi:uncharacterized protein (DUF433 family)